MSGLGSYIERETKIEAGTSAHSPGLRGHFLDLVRDFVLSSQHYIPLNQIEARSAIERRIPSQTPHRIKNTSRRVYYDQANQRLQRNGVEWRIKKTEEGYVQGVKVGRDMKGGRLEISRPIEGPGPDVTVFTREERSQIERAAGKRLEEFNLLPLFYYVTQGWVYSYAPKNNPGARIEHKQDRGALVTIFDRILKKEPIDVYQIEQELKAGRHDLEAERNYLIRAFNANQGNQLILTPTENSKPSYAVERVEGILSDKRVRDAVKEIFRQTLGDKGGVDPADFEDQCVLLPMQLPGLVPQGAAA